MQNSKDKIITIASAMWKWLVRYPIAILISVGVLLFATLLLLMGMGDRFNVGGILGRLFGTDSRDGDTPTIAIANEIPPERKDAEGNIIPKEVPDEHGWVQKEITPLDVSTNPFRDTSKVVLDVDGNKKKLQLPTGVKDTDVQTVIEVKPHTFEVILRSGPAKVDQDLIDKLRG